MFLNAVRLRKKLNFVHGSRKKQATASQVESRDIFIVKIYIYYDADGNIIDVKSVTTKFSKPMEK